MMLRELTPGFDFCSRDHLHMAVTHLFTKVGGNIFIQSGEHLSKFNMAAAAILDFNDK